MMVGIVARPAGSQAVSWLEVGSGKMALSRPTHHWGPAPSSGRCAGVLRKREPLGV